MDAADDGTERHADRVLWQAMAVAQRGRRMVQRRFADAAARTYHYHVLDRLKATGPTSQTVLADGVALDRSDLVGVLDELERLGHVRREVDPADRRRNIVSMTGSGTAALGELDALVAAADDELVYDLTPDERRTLVALLARIGRPAGEG